MTPGPYPSHPFPSVKIYFINYNIKYKPPFISSPACTRLLCMRTQARGIFLMLSHPIKQIVVHNIGKIEGFVKREGKNLKEILKNGIQEGNQFRMGTKNVAIGA
jgi:hypothetical protein